MRNIYYVHIDYKTNTTEVYDVSNDKIKNYEGIEILDYINITQKALVFCNLLYYIKKYKYPGGSCVGEDYVKFGQFEPLSYEYGNVIFRNIACFLSGQSENLLTELYPNVPITFAMRQFILSYGEKEENVKNTIGYMMKKRFYKNIKDQLWEEKKANKAYYYKLETYKDMMTSNKSGALCYDQSYGEDVLCYDKRSAYASVIINDDNFPIGQMRLIKFQDAEKLKRLVSIYIKTKTYFRIIVDGIVPGFEEYYDEEAHKTSWEKENILDIIEEGTINKFYRRVKQGKIYKCTKTGYVSKYLRDETYNLYNKKESTYGVEKFFVKTSLNILVYGKSIQNYDFKTVWDLQNHYKGRGDNYINPEMGLHCQAVLLHEIHKAQRNNIAIYWDTDGIKVKDTPEARKYFEKQNQLILEKNKKSGYDSNIGTWKLECVAKRFISFGAKRYIIEKENGEYELTWSGMLKEDKERILKALGNDKIGNAMKKPILARYHKLKYNKETNKFEIKIKSEIIKFEGDYEWQKRKQNEDISKSNQSSKSIQKQDTTSSLADVVRERRILHSKNVSEMQLMEKESLHTSEDTKNLLKKPILTTLLEHTTIGLTDTQVESGIKSCIIGPASISRGGGRMTMECGKKKQGTHNQLVVHGR